MIRTAPCSVQTARILVGRWHRHSLPPRSGLFAVRAVRIDADDVVDIGVAIVGRPVARRLDDGETCEVTRLATDGTPNACSLLYGACSRAAKALGYSKIITYTLEREGGSSLRASGWTLDSLRPATHGWDVGARARYDTNLLGENRTRHGEAKYRWTKALR